MKGKVWNRHSEAKPKNLPKDGVALLWRCFASLSMTALCSCAGPAVTALDVEIARHQAEAARACYAAQIMPEGADARDAALLALTRALTGDPCRATNVYDGRAQIAASQNRALGAAVSGAVLATGVIAGADVLKAAVRQTGNQTVTNIAGDRNSAAHYDTRANVDNRISTRGANSAARAETPAAGPDLSRRDSTTVHHGAE